MKPLTILIRISLCCLPLGAAACAGLFPTRAPTLAPEIIYTQAAETVIAALTQNAPPVTPTTVLPAPTDTPAATSTPLPTITTAPTSTSLPTQTPSPQPTATEALGSLTYSEDFSGDSGWIAESGDSWSMGQADGGYAIRVRITNAPIWSVRSAEYTDARLEVDAARTDGPVDGYFGLVCRHLNGDNYYTLVIGSDGFYGIAIKEAGDKLQFLVEGRDEAGVIATGSAVNRLRADCVGSTLALFANGHKLAEVQDAAFEAGDSGLLAGTRKESGLRVLFDNFAVYEP